jgi:hypothetical protein
MGDFMQFYFNGGVFMHVITLAAAAAVGTLVFHARVRRHGPDDPKLLSFAERLAWLCVAVGLLGSAFGLVEMNGAMSSLDPEAFTPVTYDQVRARAMTIVPTTLSWGLMCAIPLWLVASVRRVRAGVRSAAKAAPE